MMTIVTHVHLREGAGPDWDAAMRTRLSGARKASGWIGGQLLRPAEKPDRRVIVGTWRTRADWEVWHHDPQFTETRQRLPERDLMKRIRANGVDFAYLEDGEGPLVLLLHGFPDTARSWSHQMPALAAAGYRAVAPYLRGYPPTKGPRDGFYDMGTLATDIAELIRELSGRAPVHIVGQDWGAAITYSVLAAWPEIVRRAVVMAVPHRAQVAKSMLDPKHVHHSFH
jgi:heme-degrading monooxygenase HmoA